MALIDDKQIIADFVIESRERLADVENQILAIEAGGADADAELVNDVFRAVHSIKGAAGFLGLATLGRLAHTLENVLNQVRNGKLVLTAEATDALLQGADALRRMLDDVEHSNSVDVSSQIEALQAIVAVLLEEESSGQADSAMPCPEGASDAPAACPATDVPTAEPAAEKTPTPSEAPSEATSETPSEATTPAAVQPATSPRQAPVSERPSPSNASPPAGAAAESTAPDAHIRVSVNVLDRLMNLAGELVLARNQLVQIVGSEDQTLLDSVAARVNQVTSELQESIMQTRLQTIDTVFGKFPRVVRDLSNSLGKQCQLTLEGREVELDKSIIEAISDPLTHLIRNAIDHGIEMPEQRIAAGKPAAGTIALRAFHQAGKVVISISDDGAGIDAERLREKSIARGLISAEQVRDMSERELLQLIFRPGFSTAEQVTQVSGRGVGMDVVKTNIERLGGTVAIETTRGAGTTISVKLPLTLAIVPALIVCCGPQRFAIPQASINELVRVKRSEAARHIQRVNGAEVLRLRGALLPLIRLADALRVERSSDEPAWEPRTWNIIVVEAGHLRYGLMVDGLHDSEEIVVKPLGRHIKDCPSLAGATILGDGSVAMILDATSLAAFCQLGVPQQDDASSKADAATEPEHETQTVLLFRNDPAEQFAVPMQWIARLERVRTDRIDSVGGEKVLQYRGGTLPLLAIEELIRAKPRPESTWAYVLVFSVQGHEAGVLVHELIDMQEIDIEVDMRLFHEPGVIGSTIVAERTTRLIDLHALARAAHPEWLSDKPANNPEGTAAATILLAEDSGFFRAQLAGFLEGAGYDVVACADGQIAWETLTEADRPFDLLVTDLEMPNLDGFGLARRIRENPSTAGLPIIAVTSLAGEDDQRRGAEAGIDEYHVKIEREHLLETVRNILKSGVRARQPEAVRLGRS